MTSNLSFVHSDTVSFKVDAPEYTRVHMFLPADHGQLFPGNVAISLKCTAVPSSTEASQTHNISAQGVDGAYLCGCLCLPVHILSACMLSVPPCISHCPPPNDGERTDSLKHLILPPTEPSK